MGMSTSRVKTGPKKINSKLRTCVKVARLLVKARAVKFVPKAKLGQSVLLTHTLYANLAASKYCKDPNYAKKSKGGKRKGR